MSAEMQKAIFMCQPAHCGRPHLLEIVWKVLVWGNGSATPDWSAQICQLSLFLMISSCQAASSMRVEHFCPSIAAHLVPGTQWMLNMVEWINPDRTGSQAMNGGCTVFADLLIPQSWDLHQSWSTLRTSPYIRGGIARLWSRSVNLSIKSTQLSPGCKSGLISEPSVPQLPLPDNTDTNSTWLMVCCESEGDSASIRLRTGPDT